MPSRGPAVRMHTPDHTLLRRFGLVRAVGGGAYIAAVLGLLVIVGWQVWPLALGVPILASVTTWYFLRSDRYPRTAVAVSLVADAVVLGGAVSYFGGSGSGLVMLYVIPVVSAGILLGPSSALGFTMLGVVLGFVQLLLEEVGLAPALLHREPLDERLPILLSSLAGVASVGYLSGIYADRLHELIARAGDRAEDARRRGETRRSFVDHAGSGVREPLGAIEQVAEELTEGQGGLAPGERDRLAARLRIAARQLGGEVDQLVDLGVMDAAESRRPEPLLLPRVVEDCLAALHERLGPYVVVSDVPPLKVLGDRRAARRVVYNLLENVVEHTPPGTTVRIGGVTTAGNAVLVITDDGPGIPSTAAVGLFSPPGGDSAAAGGRPSVGLPLVRELCRAMGAEVRYEPAPSGGARFLVAFRRAPAGAPSLDDQPPAGTAPTPAGSDAG